MKSRAVRYWLAMLLFTTTTYVAMRSWRHYSAQAANSPTAAPALPASAKLDPYRIALTDQDGRMFRTAQLRGKVWLASYFFTACPSVCVKLNQALAQLQKEAPAELHLVSITCDPENDKPEVLKRYAERIAADAASWTFLTGKISDIRRGAKSAFQVGVDEGTHSDRVFVVDGRGQVRGNFRVTEPHELERLKKMLRSLGVSIS